MKKYILAILASTMLSATAFAGGVNIGITASIVDISASGTETQVGENELNTAVASNDTAIGSVFIEYSMDNFSFTEAGNGITVGYSSTPGEASVNSKFLTRVDAAGTPGTDDDVGFRAAQAKVSDYNNVYVEVPLFKWVYVKYGHATIDVVTQETSDGDNGTYGDAALDGEVTGIGLKGMVGDHMVWKLAYEETDFDTLNLTSTTSNKIKADIDTEETNVSIAYRF